MGRNLSARNFGFKTRDMKSAGNKAIAEKGGSFKTQADLRQRFNLFVKYLKNDTPIRRLNDVTKDTLRDYANHLQDRDLDTSTIHDYLSAINVTLEQCRLDKKVHLDPVGEAGVAKRNGIAVTSKFVAQHDHDQAKNEVSSRLAVMMDLQREFGLRFKESALIDAKKCLDQLDKSNSIQIERGAKGGQERMVPLNDNHQSSQIEVLKKAAEIQGKQYTLVPKELTYKQFQQQCYRELHNTKINGFHCERHTYANDRYEQLTGYKSPVETGFKHGKSHIENMAKDLGKSSKEAKDLDQKARLIISEELGHHRIDVTNKYLG